MRVVGPGRWEEGRRAQAIQLGALLLFAILIINLSLYQIFVVPDQNGEIEFKHSQQVQSEMLDVRNSVLDAATGDQSFVEVDLGPSYPSRTLFVNPGQPAGTIRTTEEQQIRVFNDTSTNISSDVCPGDASTRALEYRIGYNVYTSAPTYRVEHTVLFREFPGRTLPGSGQQLVTNDSINLIPVRNRLSESGGGAATVEPVPGGVLTTTVTDPSIELPTEYDQELWRDTLEGQIDRQNVTVSGGTLKLEPEGTFTLYCTAVGINGAPPSGARQGSLVGGGSSGSGGGVNPAGFSEVRLTGISGGSGAKEVQITLKNTDDQAKSLARGRIPFYYTGGSSGNPTFADLNGNDTDRLKVREDLEVIDQNITLGAGTEETLVFNFDEKARDDFYVFDVVYSDGTTATYYIDTPKSSRNSGNNPTATPTPTPALGSNPPSVSIDSTSVSEIGNSGQYNVDVTFTGNDPDGDIASYTVRLYDSSSKALLLDQSSDTGYTGGQTTATVKDSGAGNPSYYVVVTVTDGQTNTDSAESST